MEKFKQIPNTNYSISTLGRLRNDKRYNKFLSSFLTKTYEERKEELNNHISDKFYLTPMYNKRTGYSHYQYRDLNGKMYWKYVHRLVAEIHIGIQPGVEYECDHINNNRNDNRLENLRWVLLSDNRTKVKFYHTGKRSKSTLFTHEVNVYDWEGIIIEKFDTVKECADHYGVQKDTIHKKCHHYQSEYMYYNSDTKIWVIYDQHEFKVIDLGTRSELIAKYGTRPLLFHNSVIKENKRIFKYGEKVRVQYL